MSLLATLLLAVQAADWPGFRGPGGDGVAPPSADPPVEWSATRNVAWMSELPGRGRSSPVVMGGKVFLTAAVERGVLRKKIGPDDMQTAEHVTLLALAVDAASGKILWRTALREVENPDPVHWLNSWATPTPAVEPGRLYCEFGGWGTWALDPGSGKVLWEKRIPFDHQVGPGSSPTARDGVVYLARDGREAQYVTALDGRTGEALWKTPRPPVKTGHANSRKSFSSPILVGDLLLAVGPHWIQGLDPASGRERWRLRHGDGYSIGSAPVFAAGRAYFSTGCNRASLLALSPGEGELPESAVAWRIGKGVPVMSSPVAGGDWVSWVSDDGVAVAVDAATGTTRWQSRLGEQHVASPLFAGGRLYFFGRDGKTTVVRPGAEFATLSENKLEGTVSASPAAVGKALFLRTDARLYRIEAR